MHTTIKPRGDLLSKYVLQTCNTLSLVNEDLLMRFSDQLDDSEYLLFDYLCFQGLTIQQAAEKIELCSSKVYTLLEKIKSKGLSFLKSGSKVILNQEEQHSSTEYRLAHDNYLINTSLHNAA